MCATPTRSRARSTHRSVRIGTSPGRCGFPSQAGAGAEALIERIRAGEPMTVTELLHAAAVLDRLLPTRRLDVLVARVRIAVRLEQLGA
jgi:hypothetical protein